MKTTPPDRRHIVKELEERLKKKWAAEKPEEPAQTVKKKTSASLKKNKSADLFSGLSNPV